MSHAECCCDSIGYNLASRIARGEDWTLSGVQILQGVDCSFRRMSRDNPERILLHAQGIRHPLDANLVRFEALSHPDVGIIFQIDVILRNPENGTTQLAVRLCSKKKREESLRILTQRKSPFPHISQIDVQPDVRCSHPMIVQGQTANQGWRFHGEGEFGLYTDIPFLYMTPNPVDGTVDFQCDGVRFSFPQKELGFYHFVIPGRNHIHRFDVVRLSGGTMSAVKIIPLFSLIHPDYNTDIVRKHYNPHAGRVRTITPNEPTATASMMGFRDAARLTIGGEWTITVQTELQGLQDVPFDGMILNSETGLITLFSGQNSWQLNASTTRFTAYWHTVDTFFQINVFTCDDNDDNAKIRHVCTLYHRPSHAAGLSTLAIRTIANDFFG